MRFGSRGRGRGFLESGSPGKSFLLFLIAFFLFFSFFFPSLSGPPFPYAKLWFRTSPAQVNQKQSPRTLPIYSRSKLKRNVFLGDAPTKTVEVWIAVADCPVPRGNKCR